MIRITRQGSLESKEQRAHHYSLGGRRVVFDTSVDSLQAYSEGLATEGYSDMLKRLPAPMRIDAGNSRMRYSGLTPLGGELQAITCWSHGNSFQIDVNERPICRIDLINSHIQLTDAGSFDERLNLEVITGPALMLMLAQQGIYSLHGGAVTTHSGTAGFIAESGVGKSTLSADADAEWVQVCDDIMPLQRLSESEPRQFFIQDYPQLKLPSYVPARRSSGRLQLDALFRLRSEPADTIEFRRLEKTEAMLQIVRHTVAAKLFNKTMMKDHARFAKRLSTAVPVFEVSYPRDLQALPDLRRAIVQQLSARDSS